MQTGHTVIQSIFNDPRTSFIYFYNLCKQTGIDFSPSGFDIFTQKSIPGVLVPAITADTI